MGGLHKSVMTSKDERVDVNSEVFGAMKVVKLQAWERPFIDRMNNLREHELGRLQKYLSTQCIAIMLYSAVPLAVSLSTFAAYVFSGNELDVATALTSLALFDILRFPLFILPTTIFRFVEAGVSMERVRSFLMCEEHDPIDSGELDEIGSIRMSTLSSVYESLKPQFKEEDSGQEGSKELAEKDWELSLLQSQLDEAEMKIKQLTRVNNKKNGKEQNVPEESESADFEAYSSSNMLCLKRINFECKPGELVAVVGEVGSGKSSLLNGILGETRKLSGNIEVNGKLAYFSQNPFILNATVKANILFSHVNDPVNEAKYKRAIECCALKHDLEMLPNGDQTEIGEKGITLR